MKKYFTFLIFLLLLFFNSSLVLAIEKQDKQQVEDNPKIERLYDYIQNMKTDEEILNGLDAREYITNYMKNGQGSLSTGQLIKACTALLLKEVRSTLQLMISLIVLAIISALLRNLQSSFSGESVSNIAFYACYAVMIMLLTKSFLISLNLAKETITKLSDFTAVLLPSLVFLLATVGGLTQAATADPIVVAAVGLTPRLYIDIIIPIILTGFVLGFVNNLSEEHKINGLCKVLKQYILWFQGIIMTIFIGLLTVRGIASNTLDVVTLKTAKFAVDNFIPIVGKALSDTIATMAGYSLLLKNAISSIGLLIIIILMLFPVIKIAIIAFVYKISAALIEPIADKRIVNCVVSASESLILLMSCVISITVMFFIMVSIMASAGKFIVGG
ncbi:stage III sporulation protein AE [Clostridium polyendosporum]|uniref:Stage III sporulation protein AE n=1 Tax=Clostridium polyendosporum TaxID=69208 RepID=A0A919RX25_9CLOT|nr:stage III sporulation protein AE [Clostridium polyendosporum]GIM27951.1 stage III sporulation protein AE [Clostridium polyendosporum]